jgi:hypothetical protein
MYRAQSPRPEWREWRARSRRRHAADKGLRITRDLQKASKQPGINADTSKNGILWL